MPILLEKIISSKVKTLDELKTIRKKKNKETLVLASGCFDIIHTDHLEYLAWSKRLGDYLVVAINSDESIKKIKGNGRPVISLNSRIKLLAVNCFIDYITVFDESNVVKIIEVLKPDIFSRGKVHSLDKDTETAEKREMNQDERMAVKNYGGEICFLNKSPEHSTTRLIEIIKNGH